MDDDSDKVDDAFPAGAAVRQAIEASHAAYVAAVKRGDMTALGTHFTEDAIFLPPHADMQRSRATIEQWFGSWLPSIPVQDFEIKTADITVVGATAYEVGTYQMTLAPAGARPISDQGKYLMVWQRGVDGRWRILRDMFNTSAPPPASK